jgi:hypothetical protein
MELVSRAWFVYNMSISSTVLVLTTDGHQVMSTVLATSRMVRQTSRYSISGLDDSFGFPMNA